MTHQDTHRSRDLDREGQRDHAARDIRIDPDADQQRRDRLEERELHGMLQGAPKTGSGELPRLMPCSANSLAANAVWVCRKAYCSLRLWKSCPKRMTLPATMIRPMLSQATIVRRAKSSVKIRRLGGLR